MSSGGFILFYPTSWIINTWIFLSAILITIYAEVWARILKTPATTVLMPTVIPLSWRALYLCGECGSENGSACLC